MKNDQLLSKPERKAIHSWLLVFLWMTVIFLFSAQSGADSGALSGGFLEKIAALLTWLRLDTLLSRLPVNFHLLIRKTAHFTEYLILGILVTNALGKKGKSSCLFLKSQLICTLYAVSDEVHQLFIPGRAGQVRDVLIDSLGACTGILLLLGLTVVISKRKNVLISQR